MRYCMRCHSWLHDECLQTTTPPPEGCDIRKVYINDNKLDIPNVNDAFVESLSTACPLLLRLAQIPIIRGGCFGIVGNYDLVTRARALVYTAGQGDESSFGEFASDVVIKEEWCGSLAEGEETTLGNRLDSALALVGKICVKCKHVV
jgi:hypothetical protein